MSRRHLGCVDGGRRSPSPRGQHAARYSPQRHRYSPSASPCRQSPARRGRPAAGNSMKTVSTSVTKSLATAAKQGTLDDTNMLNIHNVVNLSMSESGQLRHSGTPNNKGVTRGGHGDTLSMTRSGRAYSKARSSATKKKQQNSSFMDLFSCRRVSPSRSSPPRRASPRKASPGRDNVHRAGSRRASPGARKDNRRSCSQSSNSPSPVRDANDSSVRFRSDKHTTWNANVTQETTGLLSWIWGGGASEAQSSSRYKHQSGNGRIATAAVSNRRQRQMEKRREYAGESTHYKENQLSHLYGLDGTDCEDYYSDVDSLDGHQGHKRRSQGNPVARWLGCLFNRLYCLLAHGVIADLFLLSRTSALRRRCGLCCLIPLFIFLPLLLLGGYMVRDRDMIAPVSTYVDKVPLLSYFTYFTYFTSPVVHRSRQDSGMSDAELEARVKHMVHNLEKQRQDLAAEQRTQWGVPGMGQDPLGLAHCAGTFKDGGSQFEALVRKLVQEEMVRFQADSRGGGTADGQAAASAQQAVQIRLLQEKLDELRNQSESLALQISQSSRSEPEGSEYSTHHLQLRLTQLQADTLALKQTQQALLDRLKLCCRDDAAVRLLVTAGVQQHLAKVMLASSDAERRRIRGEPYQTTSANPFMSRDNVSETFGAWLAASYVSPGQLDSRVAALAAKIQRQVAVTARASAMQAVATADAAKVAANDAQQDSFYEGIDDQHIEALILKALAVYDADKTGKVDFALESAGGSILSTRCSQTYHRRTAQLSLFGVPLWYASNSARTVIQPGMYPGQCWAFRGSTGYVVIQLAGLVDITSVSMEHISKALSPYGQIDSAPKQFSVWGLESESDMTGVLLGNHTYNADGPPLQYFEVAKAGSVAYRIVELRITSNHGNKEYTCLYRLRVHGHLTNW